MSYYISMLTQPKLMRRATASIIDYSVFFGFVWIICATLGVPYGRGYMLGWGAIMTFPIFWFIWFPVMETVYGQTLGKKLLDLKVVTMTGRNISFGAAVKRRLIDSVELFFYGIIAMVTVKKTPHHQRVGDLWAKTVVIGEEETSCKSCNAIVVLSFEEVVRDAFVCPKCQTENRADLYSRPL